MIKTKNEYINREISWLHFNARVLQESKDPRVPLIDRLRFLGIFSNNLDEFFKVRYATVKRIVDAGKTGKNVFGMRMGDFWGVYLVTFIHILPPSAFLEYF